jgi:ribosome maturation factor RimP
MRWLRQCAAVFYLFAVCVSALGAEFKTVTGDVYKGELSAVDKDGIVVRLESGDFSQKIDWAKLTDATLTDLRDNPKAGRFVEPYLAEPEETVAIQQAKEIAVKQPTRVELPAVRKGLYSALTSPNGIILLAALFLANLYGAYEIARFKWRPVALVCGVSAVAPVIGPIIFLLLHRAAEVEVPNATEEAVETATLSVAQSSSPLAQGGGAASALGISKGQATAQAEGQPKVFKRGEFTFNRRFFETQFPSFFRVVASEADKDLVLDVAAGKKSVVASRISRIAANEIHFKTATNQEVTVMFSEIAEVKLRPKDG